MTANEEVQTREEATVFVKELDLFVTVVFLEETPAVLSLGKPCGDHGYTYHWTRGQKPHSPKMARDLIAIYQTMYHSLSLGLSTSSSTSSTPTSSTSSSKDSVSDTEHPAAERSGSVSVESRRNPLPKPEEIKNTNKNEDGEVQSDLLHDLPDWLQEFRENLVGENVPIEPRGDPSPGHRDTSSSSYELQMGREQKWNRARASIVCTLFSRKTQIAISVWRRK